MLYAQFLKIKRLIKLKWLLLSLMYFEGVSRRTGDLLSLSEAAGNKMQNAQLESDIEEKKIVYSHFPFKVSFIVKSVRCNVSEVLTT